MPALTRRDALRLVGIGAGAALAGCIEDPTGGGSTHSPTPALTSTSTPSPTPGSGEPEPPNAIENEWPAPAHDPGLTNHADVSGPDGPVGPLWAVDLGDEPTSPIVSGRAGSGTAVFVGAGESVVSVDARTGEKRWTEDVGAVVSSIWAVTEDLHVVGESAVYGLDPATGDRRWTVETDPISDAVETDPVGDAVVTDRGAYALRIDSDEAPTLARVADEEVQWSTELDERGLSWGRVVDAGEAILAGGLLGDVVTWWAIDPETGQVQNRSGDVSHYPVPIAHRDGATYALEAFYATFERFVLSGEEIERDWRTGLDDAHGGPWPIAVSPDALYTHTTHGEGAGLHAIDAETGDPTWTQGEVEAVEALVSTEGSVLVHDGDALRAFDPDDGTERWQAPVGSADGGLCVVDDLVIVAGEDGLVGYRSRA